MTPEALLQAWREAFEVVQVFEHAELDEVGQARLAELRANEASLAEQVRAAGLIPEAPELRVGAWAPLPLYLAGAADDALDAESADSPGEEAGDSLNSAASTDQVRFRDHGDVVRWIDSIYNRDLSRKKARKRARNSLRALATAPLEVSSLRLLAAALEDFGVHDVAQRVRARNPELEARFFENQPPAPRTMPRPFLPSIRDGLTHAQRTIVEVAAESAPNSQRVKVLFDDALLREPGLARTDLSEALDQLLVLPYPLVEVARAQSGEERTVRLTSLGREFVHRADDGRFRVHGAFVPNLLINGCGESLAFPTHSPTSVVAATAFIARIPGATAHQLWSLMRPLNLGSGPQPVCNPIALYSFGHEVLLLAAGLETLDGARSLRLCPLLPLMKVDEVVERLTAAARERILEGFVSAKAEPDGSVVIVFEHRAFASEARRKLPKSGVLVEQYACSFRVDIDAREELRPLHDLLIVFLETGRGEISRRLQFDASRAKDRLELVDGLLRAADHETQVNAVLDCALDTQEAVWALTHLGTEAFSAHPAFGGCDATGLAPFSDAQARLIVKSGRLVARQARLVEERAELVSQLASLEAVLVSTDRLNSLVIAEIERIARLHSHAASRLTPQSERTR